MPAGEWVLRVAVLDAEFQASGRASPAAFELSSEDKKGVPPRLSVWVERLTTPAQAWSLMGENPDYQLALRLNVDAIRSLRPEPEAASVPSLDVEWEPLMTRSADRRWIPDSRPGAEGHAVITGLMRGGAVSRIHTKSLRSQLADLAEVILLPVGPPT